MHETQTQTGTLQTLLQQSYASAGEYQFLHDYCREVYDAGYDDWNFCGKPPYAWIEPGKMYAIRIQHD